ncbi:MAG: alpha/beta hydrolase [Bacteroidota bacterium]
MQKLLNHEVYLVDTNAKWIVFLHGAGGSIATWNKQIEAFKPFFNLLLIDLRDHGDSKDIQPEYKEYSFQMVSEDIKKVMKEVEISKAHFVTLSFGSILIQDFTMRYPEALDKIVVVGGVFSGTPFIRAFVFAARFFNLFLSYRTMYRIFSYVLMPYKRNQKARTVYQQYAARLTQKEYLKWIGLYYEFFNLLKTYHERNSDHDMLIIMGEDDYVFLDGAKKLAENQPNTELHILPKVGHIANIEAPKAFNALAVNFLKDQEETLLTREWSETSSL